MVGLVALLSCAGCDQSARQPASPVTPSDLAQMGTVRYASPALDQPKTADERRASLAASTEAMTAVSTSINRLDAQEWQEADRRFQRALAGLDGLARERAEQIAGIAMIRVYLPNAPDTPEARAVAARYVRHLVETESPEAGVVLDGLARVGDHWDSAEKAAAARRAADAAQPTIDRALARQSARRSGEPDRPETLGETSTPSDLEAAQADLRRLAEGV